MHLVHVTAEMAPIAKVGGLADVVTGLARASLLRGHTVHVMLPFYECIQKHQINDLTLVATYNSFHHGNWIPTNAYTGIVSGIPVILIDPSHHFFKGHHVYGGSYNELEAYLFFSRACLEWMQVITWKLGNSVLPILSSQFVLPVSDKSIRYVIAGDWNTTWYYSCPWMADRCFAVTLLGYVSLSLT